MPILPTYMTRTLRRLSLFVFALFPQLALAATHETHNRFIAYFKNEDGSTNWQYVANFSSGVLIILLSLVTLVLLITWIRVRRYNKQLVEIKGSLEKRVKERTATLDESNRLLQDANSALEKEVSDHVATSEQLRRSEAYLQSILHSMPMILVGLDSNGNITHWNPQAERASGIFASDAIGQYLWSIYPDITVSPKHIQQAHDKGEALTLRHSQPGSYHFDITIYPLEGEYADGVVLLVDDVTKRVFAENMIIQHDKLASMGELASSMAHDISAPLQEILFDLRSFQSALESGNLIPADVNNSGETAKLQQLVEDASRHGQQVDAIVRNLLRFARGRSERPEATDIEALINSAVDQAQDGLTLPGAYPFNHITIEREYAADLPRVAAYVTALQQVFVSLLRHSYQALVDGKPEQPRIRIEVMDNYGSILVRVNHNGRLLTADEQVLIFEPYHQGQESKAEDATTDVAKDAGNRLSFSYYVITEQHQGHMAVTSDANSGTTFHIQLDPARPLQAA